MGMAIVFLGVLYSHLRLQREHFCTKQKVLNENINIQWIFTLKFQITASGNCLNYKRSLKKCSKSSTKFLYEDSMAVLPPRPHPSLSMYGCGYF